MESGAIPDNMVTARSVWGSGHEPWRGRLGNTPSLPYTGRKDTGSYSAKTSQQGEWLQIDLGVIKHLTKVATQGRPHSYSQWITKYTISYSDNSTTWFPYEENKIVKVTAKRFVLSLFPYDLMVPNLFFIDMIILIALIVKNQTDMWHILVDKNL